MRGLDIIGAGENLASQTIMLRIRSIDAEKLRQAVTDKPWGGAIPGAVSMANTAPELALGIALPIAKSQLARVGIDADLSTTKTPPKANPPHEMLAVWSLATVFGVALAFVGQALYHSIKQKRAT